MNNKPSQITLDFMDDIQTRDSRIIDFLGEKIIVNKNVFPLDSEFSHSSMMTAQNIPYGLNTVLDIGTGTGVQAIIAAKRGAKKVLATDIDDNSLQNAGENIAYHGLQNIIELRKSDLWENIQSGEKLDLILAQLPFADCDYISPVSHFLFDPNFRLHDRVLAKAKQHLNSKGKLFISGGEISNDKLLLDLIKKYGYKIDDIKEEIVNSISWKLYILMDNK
ncbi:MAG: methyltransferase [Candidatus Absconditicoccaceae bacterium]